MLNALFDEVDSIIARDPAARHRWEVITCYPGLHAVWLHRVAHFLWKSGLQWVARFWSMLARLSALFARAELQTEEIDLLRGIAKQMLLRK